MPSYVGYSSLYINQPRTLEQSETGVGGGQGTLNTAPQQGRRYRVYDSQLVQIDILNAFNIRQGDKVGQPSYGTRVWSMLFEPNVQAVRDELEAEIRRVVASDPRVTLDSLVLYENDTGVLVQLQITVQPFDSTVQLQLLLNRNTGQASLV